MNAIAKTAPAATILRPQSFADLYIHVREHGIEQSAMVPRDYQGNARKHHARDPNGQRSSASRRMQSLQNIACVNGPPAVCATQVI